MASRRTITQDLLGDWRLKILILTHGFNSLSQRLYIEMASLGHEISVEYDISDAITVEAVKLFGPDVIVAPFLKRAIPPQVFLRVPCFIVHPGLPGDRGPHSLDWAILEDAPTWGVTLLQANHDLDAGDIWSHKTFEMRRTSKSDLYRNEVTEAAVSATLETLAKFEAGGFRPTPIIELPSHMQKKFRPKVPKDLRRINFECDPAETVLKKIWSADSHPGATGKIAGQEFKFFSASLARGPESPATYAGSVIGRSGHSICVRCQNGAIWTGILKTDFKLPASFVLADQFIDLPLIEPKIELPGELSYSEQGPVGSIRFPFYNGAMSTQKCQELLEMVRHAAKRPTRVIVLWGGPDFWSNGIDLCAIESSPSPADESLKNIEAMNDLILEILNTRSHLTVSAMQGNAGAGGFFFALSADHVLARQGIVLNPHYKNMGNLYGSEYWTYLVPKRVPADLQHKVRSRRLPMGASEALKLGLVDQVLPNERNNFGLATLKFAHHLAQHPEFLDLLKIKNKARDQDEKRQPLVSYRDAEIKKMRDCFFGFDPSYHVARFNFLHRTPHSKTPLFLARHRQ